jgi:hypothetical protein
MLSLEKVKTILNDDSVSDEEAKAIRDGFRDLAEIIYEKYQEDKEKAKNKIDKPNIS